jgi:hypothetical protein
VGITVSYSVSAVHLLDNSEETTATLVIGDGQDEVSFAIEGEQARRLLKILRRLHYPEGVAGIVMPKPTTKRPRARRSFKWMS